MEKSFPLGRAVNPENHGRLRELEARIRGFESCAGPRLFMLANMQQICVLISNKDGTNMTYVMNKGDQV